MVPDALKKFDQSRDRLDRVVTNSTMTNLLDDRLVEPIKERHPDLPIILCTGRGDEIDKIKKLPIALVLSKPIFGDQLINAVASEDRLSRYRSLSYLIDLSQ